MNVIEKIQTDLMPNSKELVNEISEIKINGTEARVLFKNGSFIKVVTASDSSRGNYMVARLMRNRQVERGEKPGKLRG